MERKSIVSVQVEPSKYKTRFHQKCHVGPNLFAALGGRIGSHVRLRTKSKTIICSLWQRFDNSDRHIEISDLVEESSHDGCSLKTVEVLQTKKAKSVELSVIATDLHYLEKLQRLHRVSGELQEMCRNCLNDVCVTTTSVVNLKTSKLARLYGISLLHIIDSGAGSRKGVIIGKDTSLIIKEIITEERYQRGLYLSEDPPGGLEQTAALLKELVQLPARVKEHSLQVCIPKGILLQGPPGCGKTLLVQYVAKISDAYFIAINGPELIGSHPGESEENLRVIFEKAKRISKDGHCIIFIDELDAVCPRREKSAKVQENRLTAQLISLIDELNSGCRIVMIGATNRPSALDPSIRRPGRFDREILINVPTLEQRKKILLIHSAKLSLDKDVDINRLAEMTTGYSGADLACLCQEAAYQAMSESLRSWNIVSQKVEKVCMKYFLEAWRKIMPSLLKCTEGTIDVKPVKWEDIGGLDEVKLKIKQTIEWPLRYPESFDKLGVPRPKGVLLIGPPGCCKTTLVRAAATSTHSTFLALSGAQLYSPYVGDAERMLAELFHRARACAPSILFLDEIDSTIGKRSADGHHGAHVRMLSVLLNEMDGIGIRFDEKLDVVKGERLPEDCTSSRKEMPKQVSVGNQNVLVVAATNRPDLIDEALLRPGRFDRIVYVPPPEIQMRLEILKVLSAHMPLKGVDLNLLAQVTGYFTGADLKNLCQEAALHALTQDGMDAEYITQQHFMDVLKHCRPSLTENMMKMYQKINCTFH